MQIQKTVFISYRRTNIYTARAVYQYLTQHGYDAFLDYENIDSGGFGQIILNQIAARAHFILVLTPSALERCTEPADWLRREIEHAMDLKRNIVPLMFENFDFGQVDKYLVSPKLQTLREYNWLSVPAEYFDEAMNRLHTRFLNKPLEMILHPTPPSERAEVAQQKATASAAPTVTQEELSAEEYYERGLEHQKVNKYDNAIANYSKSILLNPHHTVYLLRGYCHYEKGEIDRSIADYTEAIRLKPTDTLAYLGRGLARKDDTDGAIADYTEAINLDPYLALAYAGRGIAYEKKGDHNRAINDYTEAIYLDPQGDDTFSNRGESYFAIKKFAEALADFKRANELRPAFNMTLAGMAITHHALGELQQANAIWQLLLKLDTRYRDADWVGKEHNWRPELIEEARKLITKL